MKDSTRRNEEIFPRAIPRTPCSGRLFTLSEAKGRGGRHPPDPK